MAHIVRGDMRGSECELQRVYFLEFSRDFEAQYGLPESCDPRDHSEEWGDAAREFDKMCAILPPVVKETIHKNGSWDQVRLPASIAEHQSAQVSLFLPLRYDTMS
jgi:hypothetical protein